MAKSLKDVLEYVVSNDVWIPSGDELIEGWNWVAESETPFHYEDSGLNDIPDTRYYRGKVTNGIEEIPCIKKVYWHGGPNSGDWFCDFIETMPVMSAG